MKKTDVIRLENVTENNLKHLTLEVPKHQICVFTGVSGSGKSSLVFDTIAAESQRQLNETYSAYIRNQMPQLPRPHVDRIENLSPAIVVSQKQLGGNFRSTVGTVTDLQPLLRLLFSRIGKPQAGNAGSFSFNAPEGACKVCNGLGHVTTLREELLLDSQKTLNSGAILFPLFPVGSWYWRTYVLSSLFDNDKPIRDYTDAEKRALLYGKPNAFVNLPSKSGFFHFEYEGLVEKITRLFIRRAQKNISENVQKKIAPFLRTELCPQCHGSRLAQRVLNCKIEGYNLADYCAMEIRDLFPVVQQINSPVAATVVTAICLRLDQMLHIGLGYLSLGRETSTLSGGESQRIKMVRHLNSSLSDMLYIFDEPSIGLHPQDLPRLIDLLYGLRDNGNSVLVVEHCPEIIKAADNVIDIGPGAGSSGGEIVYQGSPDNLASSHTLTGQYLCQKALLKSTVRAPRGWMTVHAAGQNNLKSFTAHVPCGVLCAIAGVAGSGKSTLMHQVFLPAFPDAVFIDQSPIGQSNRSTPATYTKMFDEIRKLFAVENHVDPSLFSFNSQGACTACRGAGYIYTDLAFMDPIRTTCPLCGGMRYRPELLAYTLRGRTINDVLMMTVADAQIFFHEPKIGKTLQLLTDAGLGYLTLGQPLSSLSGGECQRLKLANELQKRGRIYIMDEPTAGLHMADVQRLLQIVDRLLARKDTVIVIEHDLQILSKADYILELGPGAGKQGGNLIFSGTPHELAEKNCTPTGVWLHKLIV